MNQIKLKGCKDKTKGTISGKSLKDKAYKIAINLKYDGYQKGLAAMVYKFFDKKKGAGMSVNKELAQEFYKPVIKNIKKGKFMLGLNIILRLQIWLKSSFNRGFKYLLCVTDVFTKYASVKPLKDKKN